MKMKKLAKKLAITFMAAAMIFTGSIAMNSTVNADTTEVMHNETTATVLEMIKVYHNQDAKSCTETNGRGEIIGIYCTIKGEDYHIWYDNNHYISLKQNEYDYFDSKKEAEEYINQYMLKDYTIIEHTYSDMDEMAFKTWTTYEVQGQIPVCDVHIRKF